MRDGGTSHHMIARSPREPRTGKGKAAAGEGEEVVEGRPTWCDDERTQRRACDYVHHDREKIE